jgi:hypothetical protein
MRLSALAAETHPGDFTAGRNTFVRGSEKIGSMIRALAKEAE